MSYMRARGMQYAAVLCCGHLVQTYDITTWYDIDMWIFNMHWKNDKYT